MGIIIRKAHVKGNSSRDTWLTKQFPGYEIHGGYLFTPLRLEGGPTLIQYELQNGTLPTALSDLERQYLWKTYDINYRVEMIIASNFKLYVVYDGIPGDAPMIHYRRHRGSTLEYAFSEKVNWYPWTNMPVSLKEKLEKLR